MCAWNLLEDVDVDRNHLNELYPDAPSEFGGASEFYLVRDVNDRIDVGSNDLSLVHLNIRSLNCNDDAFMADVGQLKLSLIFSASPRVG